METINVLNHPNLGIPGSYPDFRPFFGKAFSSGDPRRMQLFLRPEVLPFLQRFYEINAQLTRAAKDNERMATNLAALPESYGRSNVRSRSVALSFLYALEPVAAAVFLICLAPFLAILAITICAASGASPLVAHRRVGRYGKTLWVYKFRTMWPSSAAARESGLFIERVVDEKPEPKLAPDPRVTSAFASFCRRHSIDELPQLVLIAAGRMSIVGPRPITRFELNEYYNDDAMEVLSVKPGLTGLWQVCGRSRLTYRQRKRFDLFLVRRLSAGLYFRIVALTIPDVLFPKNAW